MVSARERMFFEQRLLRYRRGIEGVSRGSLFNEEERRIPLSSLASLSFVQTLQAGVRGTLNTYLLLERGVRGAECDRHIAE
jgi:hypothetical protein